MAKFESHIQTYLSGILGGFFLGMLLIHPLSMIFQGAIHPDLSLDYWRILKAFNPHHAPMALFFGLLGVITGILVTRLQLSLIRAKRRLTALESILPICSYCRKIRDDSGTAPGCGDWMTFEQYLARKTSTYLSHGICSECYPKVLAEIDAVSEMEDTPLAKNPHRIGHPSKV